MADGGKPISAHKYFNKAHFSLALECPTKLYYAARAEYENKKCADPFLRNLLRGGLQVGALARLMYPSGVLVNGNTLEQQASQTAALLREDTATIFEATFIFEGLVARVDILCKRGDHVDLIEVKAKSFDPSTDEFIGARGGVLAKFKPYVQDLAYQVFIFKSCHHQLEVSPHLMLIDKTARASVHRLHQRIRVMRNGERPTIELEPGTDATTIGTPLLVCVNGKAAVDLILDERICAASQDQSFEAAMFEFRDSVAAGSRIPPRPSATCADCEFRTDQPPTAGQKQSGFHECWREAFDLSDADFAAGTVLDIHALHPSSKDKLIAAGVVKLSDVQPEHLKPKTDERGLSRSQRQVMQAKSEWPGDGPFYLDHERMHAALAKCVYPYHFIDFETAAVAIPFNVGKRPYGHTAFQFSHHVMHENGKVEHRSEFIETTPGVDPNVPFLRALKAALTEGGTVFRWSAYENTVLRSLREQIESSTPQPVDCAALAHFIDELTYWETDGSRTDGPRCMVDLMEIAERCFFHPATGGSNSLKKILPAVLQSSNALRAIYEKPIYGRACDMKGSNFEAFSWWQPRSGTHDPYGLLPPIFDDVSRAQMEALELDLEGELADGCAAMLAYLRLQTEAFSPQTRDEIRAALLRYCELDTLAMVMVVQAWQHWLNERLN